MNNEKYSTALLKLQIKYLREFVGERSWFDFKSNDVAPEKFGAYLAGLSNAACLANQPFGYLVFGVDDASHGSITVTIPGLPEGSNWLLPEEQKKFNGSGEPLTEPITEPINSAVDLLQVIRNNPDRRKRELAVLSGLHPSTIKRMIEGELKEQVEYRGAKRNGGYYVIGNPANPVNPVKQK